MVSYSKVTNLRDSVDCDQYPQPSWCGLKDTMEIVATSSIEDTPKKRVSLDGALKIDVNSSFMKDDSGLKDDCNDTSCQWEESCIDCHFAFRDS